MSLQAVPVCLVTMLCVLLGIDFGALAMLIGAVTGSRGAAVGLASTFAAAAYLISSLAPVVPWLHRAPVRLAVRLRRRRRSTHRRLPGRVRPSRRALSARRRRHRSPPCASPAQRGRGDLGRTRQFGNPVGCRPNPALPTIPTAPWVAGSRHTELSPRHDSRRAGRDRRTSGRRPRRVGGLCPVVVVREKINS